MNKVTVLFRALVLGVSILAANVFATETNYLITASGGSWDSGMIYSVPAGAHYEWEVSAGYNGYAHVILGGGGLNVNQTAGGGQQYYDVGDTAYADTIAYQVSAEENGFALFWLGW